ncbi:regulatory protein (GGDEF domain) [Legionella birminghamensis]|uniref:diguanylate cyclase n=1 Tax=Legionella birminghamensis TaxID=28083 RepID=A0A378I9K4_9GAMM|nr:diguanylate cyclase [Legionella birminghamensis]KTC74713.1 regulatory protein (GGDEF domain) [Legionella birminghamensis]STX31516.1 regulatory protein (GGDEF domain) [Legionella birminghamensis]
MKAEIKEKLQALFTEYARSLPEKLAHINREWANLMIHWDKVLFQDFHRTIHSLCGSAGTYGYDNLSKAARKLEIVLKSKVSQDSLQQEDKEEIDFLLDQLQMAFITAEPESKSAVSQDFLTKNGKIILIDNDRNFTNELQDNLIEAGYQVYAMGSEENISQNFFDISPAALIVDIENISEGTKDFLFKLYNNEKVSIPLFCTAYSADILTRLKAIRLGSSAFFQKPMESTYLTRKLDQFCACMPSEPYRVLVIDDSLSLAEYYTLILKESGLVAQFITNPLLLIETIEDFQPDVLLMDVYMPECSGLELAVVLRQEPQYTRLPIIFLSTEDDRLKQLSALNLGGDDFLVKPIVPQHLIKTVLSRAKRAEILNSFMTKDSLSGLYNHTNILQRLDVEIARANRQNEQLSFIMADIDHFKLINDNYGHPTGDNVIRKISSLLLLSFRKTDIIGRYGGEEFAIIMPNTSPENAFRVIENFRLKFSKFLFQCNKQNFSATVSAGLSSFPAVKDMSSLVSAADQALYEAKRNGRNQVVFADSLVNH